MSVTKIGGLVVIGVPSNHFANQELPIFEAISNFTSSNFNITFPLTDITNIKGKNAHPFYILANHQNGTFINISSTKKVILLDGSLRQQSLSHKK